MPNTYRIHPALGIARVGDSPDEYFVDYYCEEHLAVINGGRDIDDPCEEN